MNDLGNLLTRVKWSHFKSLSTVEVVLTDLEDSYMFYLMARGISETRARRMLIRAFVAEIVEELEDEPLIEALEKRIDIWMEQHV